MTTTRLPPNLIKSGAATDGHVLTADGAGGAAFEAPAGGGGGLVLLGAQMALNSASLDFTGIDGTYTREIFIFDKLKPSSSGQPLAIRLSRDNGSSWDAGGGDYAYSNQSYRSSGTNTSNASTASTSIIIAGNVGGSTGQHASGSLHLDNPDEATFSYIHGLLAYSETGGAASGLCINAFAGSHIQSAAVNGVRFFFTSGNIQSGTIRRYGIVDS